MITGIFGINIAVDDLDAARERYESVLGVAAEPLGEADFAFPGLKGARLRLGDVQIQLIQSTEPGTSVARFVEKRGEGVFLVSLETDDFAADRAELEKKGVDFVLPEPARGAFGTVDFSHPKSMHGVQFELIEPVLENA